MIRKSAYRFSEKDHTQTEAWSGMAIKLKAIPLWEGTVALNKSWKKQNLKVVDATHYCHKGNGKKARVRF